MKQKVELIFHLYCENAQAVSPNSPTETYMNKVHRKILTEYSNKFDSAIFCVVVDDTDDHETITEATKWILSCGFGSGLEIKIKKNNEYRDAQTFFDEAVSRIGTDDSIVLFAHNKAQGMTRIAEPVVKWTVFSYFSLFRLFDRNVERLGYDTGGHSMVCGYLPVYNAKTPWDYSTFSRYSWHVPGTIFMFNPEKVHDYLINNDMDVPKMENYLSAEMFFGNICDVRCYNPHFFVSFDMLDNVFYEADTFNPYEVDHSSLIRKFLPERVAEEYDKFYDKMSVVSV